MHGLEQGLDFMMVDSESGKTGLDSGLKSCPDSDTRRLSVIH